MGLAGFFECGEARSNLQVSNISHAHSHAHHKSKRQVVFPAYIQPIHAARPSQTPACTDPRNNNDPAAPATHLLLFHKHAPSESPHSAQAPPTLQEHPRRTERKQIQQCGNVCMLYKYTPVCLQESAEGDPEGTRSGSRSDRRRRGEGRGLRRGRARRRGWGGRFALWWCWWWSSCCTRGVGHRWRGRCY